MTQIKIDETIGLFFIEMDNQLKKYALQLTNNYQEAIDLLTESKRVIINNYSSNINDLKWYIYKTIKDVHISLYKEQICNSILMDNKNDCYLVLSDATIITINSPFHVDVAKNSLKHLNALQILFNRAIKNHNPKYIVVWNTKLFDILPYNGMDARCFVLPDATLIQTKIYQLGDNIKVKILPLKYHKVGLPKSFWHKAIMDFIKKESV